MRILPVALIVLGSLGVAKYYGLIPLGMGHLIGPLLLVALGIALLIRGPRMRRRHCAATGANSAVGSDSTMTDQASKNDKW